MVLAVNMQVLSDALCKSAEVIHTRRLFAYHALMEHVTRLYSGCAYGKNVSIGRCEFREKIIMIKVQLHVLLVILSYLAMTLL